MPKFERPKQMSYAVYSALIDVSNGAVPAQAARDHHVQSSSLYLAMKRHNLKHIAHPKLREQCIALRASGLTQAEISRKLGKPRSQISRAIKDRPIKRPNKEPVVMPDFDDT